LQLVTRNWQASDSSPAALQARAAHSSHMPAQVRVGQENVVTCSSVLASTVIPSGVSTKR
jgi:hypothetical protein